MKIARWVSVVAVLSSTALLFGCGLAGSGSSTSSGKGGLAITTTALPDGTVSQSYSGTLQATGGTSPYSWSETSGSLPTGLSLSTTGQITGTPTSMGNYSFQVQVTDASKHSSSGNVSVKVTGPPPTIYGISPTFGSTSGGTTVTISGKNLQSGATVTFGGVAGTSVNVMNSGQMTAVTPAHAAGSVDVVVTNPGGKSAILAAGFGYGSAAPGVSSISPNSGPTTGGTAVTITGSNFVVGALVFFGTVAATPVNVSSATQIQVSTPSVSTAAAVDVVVKNSDGQSGSLTNGFTYTDPPSNSAPTVSDVSPNTTSAGTDVAVDGTNFGSGATVNIGSTAASNVKFISSTQLTVTVPSVSPGTYDVTVKNSNGLSATLSSGLTVDAPQSLLSGCTVNASNQPVCGSNVGSASIPSGWTLVAAQGFESGSVSSSQGVAGTIENSFAHTGTHAMTGKYTGGDQQYFWKIVGSAINSLTTYVSWWEYDESQGKLNQDFFMMRRLNPDGRHDAELQFAASSCLWNCTDENLYFEPHGGGWSLYKGWTNPGWGVWTQWEVEMTINPTGSSTGSLTAWRNGIQVFSFTGKDIATTYTNWANADLRVGGVYTKLVWYTDSSHTTCATGHTSYTVNFSDWTQPDPCPQQAPPNGYVPIFKRYIDDIVVLRK